MYQRYLADPASVDPAWHDFFADYKPALDQPPGAEQTATPAGNGGTTAPAPAPTAAVAAPPKPKPAAPPAKPAAAPAKPAATTVEPAAGAKVVPLRGAAAPIVQNM